MYDLILDLYDQFVAGPELDCFPKETAQAREVLAGLELDQADACASFTYYSAATAFREGLRLGLSLSAQCGLCRPEL